MKSKYSRKTTFVILIIICTTLGMNIISSQCSANILSIGNYKEEDSFHYQASYNGTENLGFNNIEWIEIIVDTVSTSSLTIRYQDNSGLTPLRTVYPKNTLSYLPFGFESPILALPTLNNIIVPIVIASQNWTTNGYCWNNNYAAEKNSPIHNIHYKHNNFWTDVFIFSGSVNQLQYGYKYFSGEFNATYSSKNGLLLELNWDMTNLYTGNSIIFSMVLESSTIGVGWSFIFKDVVIFGSLFGGQLIFSLSLLGFAQTRRHNEEFKSVTKEIPKEEEKEDEQKDKPAEIEIKPIVPEEPIIIPKNLPDDYNFIYYCPFCNAELKEYQDVCPECGGKR